MTKEGLQLIEGKKSGSAREINARLMTDDT